MAPSCPSMFEAIRMDTTRLSLRPLCSLRQHEDAALLHSHITENVTRYWIDWDTPQSLADTEYKIAEALDRNKEGAYAGWLAHYRTRDAEGVCPFVGFVSLEQLPEPIRDAWFELNFWLTETQWRKGYAYEMAVSVLNWAVNYTDLRFITMSWTFGNEASRCVIERFVGNQQSEVRMAVKNGVSLPVYHYVLDIREWYYRQEFHG